MNRLEPTARPAKATPKPPGPIMRWLFWMPLALHRLGIPGDERLMGKRWILVTTHGRRTGKPHSVMLDLVGHDAEKNRYYVQPGWGRSSDWVRNIEADPIVEAQVGRKRFKARVLDVSGPEGAKQMFAFGKKHPIVAFLVSKFLLGLELPRGSEAEVLKWLGENFLVFALEPM